MKYGIQFNNVSYRYRIVTINCGDRQKWFPMGRLNLDPIPTEDEGDYTKVRKTVANSFTTKDEAIEAINRMRAETKASNEVFYAWADATTEEVV